MAVGGGNDTRAVRVFVSSTFRDMQLERDELVKRIFPQLRRLCAQRGVSWSEIDLRWGVTDEQAAEGAVLPICLAEIDRTRPFFIGLLGQRYGWVPDEIPAPLVDELGWLTDDLGRSVTELEILHGVLNHAGYSPDVAQPRAFFYLRDPEWVTTLPEAERDTFVETTDSGRDRLAALRERVRTSGFPTSDYTDPVMLGQQVLADFTELIDREFPIDTDVDHGHQVDAVHEAFGTARFGIHVGRDAAHADLDTHAGSDGPPLLVTGAPGVGSSSLVTNWAWAWHAAHPDDLVIVHHVDADTEASDHRALVARLVARLDPPRGGYDALRRELADTGPPELRSMMRQTVGAMERSAHRHVVVVIDGVDRLADEDGAPDLRWLPDVLPPQIRVVLTAGTRRPVAVFEHRGWPILEVGPLSDTERRNIVNAVLGVGSKQLDAAHVDAVVRVPQTGNARYLRTVLDELRQHGEHFTLGDVIRHLTSAATVDDLLELVLTRYETDFDRGRVGLTRDVFTALWAARHGLAESELLELLGDASGHGSFGGDPLPQAVWAPLHLAAEHGIVSRGGLLGLAHPDIRRAIEDRYLPTVDEQRAAHQRLAAYFSSGLERTPLPDRVADELGWQFADAGDDGGLRRTLGDLTWVEAAYRRHPADVRRLWTRLAPEGPAGVLAVGDEIRTTYAEVIADPVRFDQEGPDGTSRQLVWGVARLLADAGQLPASISVQRAIVASSEGERHRAALINLGGALLSSGDVAAAEPVLRDAIDRCRAAQDSAMLASALGNLAMIRRDAVGSDTTALEETVALYAEEEQLCRDLDDEFGLQASLANQAQFLRQIGRFSESLDRLEEQERICRDLADPVSIGRALAGRATVLTDLGDPTAAIPLLAEFAAIARAEGDVRGLAEASLTLGSTHAQLGQVDPAQQALATAETVGRQLGDPALLARVLVTGASLHGSLGNWAAAEALAREAELTARAANLSAQTALALGIVGTARRELGDLDGAQAAHVEQRTLAELAGDRNELGTADANLGNVALARNDVDTALRHYASAEAAFRTTGVVASLLPVFANRAQIHHMANRLPDAIGDYLGAAEVALQIGQLDAARQWGETAIGLAYQLGDTMRAEQIWLVLEAVARRTDDQAGLQRAIGERALMLINRSQGTGTPDTALLDEAAALLDEQEAVCRSIGDQVGLAACVGNRAIVLRYQGDLAGSLACLDEQLLLAQQTSNAQGALFATANRGEVLGLLGRRDEALQTLHQARATALQYQLMPMVQQLDMMIAGLG